MNSRTVKNEIIKHLHFYFILIIVVISTNNLLYAFNNNVNNNTLLSENKNIPTTTIDDSISKTKVSSQNTNSVAKKNDEDNKSQTKNTNNISPEIEDAERIKQLEAYQGSGMTRWLIDNEENFANIIEQTSKETKTKWYIDQDIQKANSLSNKNINKEEALDPSEDSMVIHTVIKGDTLYSIAKKYQVSQDDILSWNDIPQGSIIKVKTKLKIFTTIDNNEPIAETKEPESSKTEEKTVPEKVENKTATLPVDNNTTAKVTNAPEFSGDIQTNATLPEYKYYKVKRGDTLYSIATKNNMTTAELLTLNNLEDGTALTLDTILKIKSNYSSWSSTDKKIAQDGFLWPVVGRLLIPFGPQSGGTTNEGINILAKSGTNVKATQDGIVTYIGNGLKSFGNIILIQHTDNWVSAYAHIDNIIVKKGQQVKKGDIIAKVSNTGNVSKAQLHFELRHNIKPMDPLAYLQGYR